MGLAHRLKATTIADPSQSDPYNPLPAASPAVKDDVPVVAYPAPSAAYAGNPSSGSPSSNWQVLRDSHAQASGPFATGSAQVTGVYYTTHTSTVTHSSSIPKTAAERAASERTGSHQKASSSSSSFNPFKWIASKFKSSSHHEDTHHCCHHGAPPPLPPAQPGGYAGPSYSSYGAPSQGAAPTPVVANPFFSQPPTAGSTPQYNTASTSGRPPAVVYAGPGPSQTSSPYAKALFNRLSNTVKSNGLESFYPKALLDTVLQKAQAVDYQALAGRWRLPNVELALDLASLALYDVILFCDDSGSMVFYEDGSRIDDLKAVVEKVAEVATLFDDDGITVRFFNSNVHGDNIRNLAEVTQLVSSVKFAGSTPMGEKLFSAVLQPFVYGKGLRKPVLIITVTDGVPDNQQTVANAIQSCKDRMSQQSYGAHAVAFQFAQVGNDKAATRWLSTMDDHPKFGDIVDVTSDYESEAVEWAKKNPYCDITPGMWLLKMMLGAIDPQYDGKD